MRAKLQHSLNRLEIKSEIEPIEDQGGWLKNVNYKPKFIWSKWLRSDEPLVFIDADAVVHKEPRLFNDINADIAVHFRKDKFSVNELLSGTIFINKSIGAMRILDKWNRSLEENPDQWDQRVLEHVLSDMDEISIYKLPASYTQIFDSMKNRGEPIIEHYQHSRKVK